MVSFTPTHYPNGQKIKQEPGHNLARASTQQDMVDALRYRRIRAEFIKDSARLGVVVTPAEFDAQMDKELIRHG